VGKNASWRVEIVDPERSYAVVFPAREIAPRRSTIDSQALSQSQQETAEVSSAVDSTVIDAWVLVVVLEVRWCPAGVVGRQKRLKKQRFRFENGLKSAFATPAGHHRKFLVRL